MNATASRHSIPVALFLVLVAGSYPLQARGQVNPYNSLALQWTATGDDSTSGRASSYQLHYSTSAPGIDTLTWWNQASTVASGLPAPRTAGSIDSTRVAGLTPGTTYYFVLRVLDEVPNISGFSNVASGATLACNAPSTAPGSFAADTTGGSVTLSWTGPVDPLATSLHIYRGSTGTPYATLTNLSLTSWQDTNVSAGSTYSYRMAWASSCADGPSTGTVSVTLAGQPSVAAEGLGASVHVYPNPSRSGDAVQMVIKVTGSSPQPVEIRLFDMNGHWVATLAHGSYDPGDHTLSWSRMGRSGHRVAPGYYEALGTVGSVRVRDRILLLP